MGRSIVKQPNGKYACFSSIVDNFILTNTSKEEYIEYMAKEAYTNTKEKLELAFKEIEENSPRQWRYASELPECLDDIERVHGNEERKQIEKEIGL